MTDIAVASNLFAWSGQAALLIGTALLAIRIARLDAPGARYLLLRIVLAAAVALPFVQPRLPVVVDRPHQAGRVDAVTQTVADATSTIQPAGISSWPAWTTMILTVVVAGAALRLVWIAVGILRLRGLRRAGALAPAGADLDELQAIIGTNATVRYVSGLGQPVTFGLLRPVVLLPDTLRAKPPAIERAVLAHELWHVRRRDWMWTVVEEVLRAVFWFHPAVWVLLSRIQAAREEVVDELSILATGSRRSYVDALLAFADEPPVFAATAFARRRHLMRRMVLISKEAVMSARRVVGAGAMAVLATVSTGWYAVQAFPLTQQSAGAQSAGIGPVEMRARPITPENPIPRRTYSVPVDYPDAAGVVGARGTVTVRLVIDESGRVAETRVAGFSVAMPDASVALVGNGFDSLERVLANAYFRDSTKANPEAARAAFEAMAEAATRSVSRWLYAPPEDGPLAFSVDVHFAPSGVAAPPPPPPPPPPGTRPRGAVGAAPPPPPPAPAADYQGWAMTDCAMRVGGNIKAPQKLVHVPPVYPPIAQSARVQGVVILEARIEGDGSVGDVRVLRSIPLLDEAAITAVRQWRFTPTVLNGQAVPVIVSTTVSFRLE